MTGIKGPFLVIGAQGMLGTDLVARLTEAGIETVGVDVDQIDIRRSESVEEALDRYKPGLVINAVALTDVDGCESRVEEAFLVNGKGAENLALGVLRREAFLMHVSTDYVFDGSKQSPYTESDPMNPTGVYGRSK
ncbi:MAG: sugar nucleotide-binding protein, partial [Deltaproteobacteria bacterium]|nr:sugar nucleotide-binding protein [Deltaproteobacteria bacterium]